MKAEYRTKKSTKVRITLTAADILAMLAQRGIEVKQSVDIFIEEGSRQRYIKSGSDTTDIVVEYTKEEVDEPNTVDLDYDFIPSEKSSFVIVFLTWASQRHPTPKTLLAPGYEA